MPKRNNDDDEYPRETEDDETQAGTSYEEIKRVHEESIKEFERQFEEQKDGRRTLESSEIDETDESPEEHPEQETKTEKEPEDVDLEQLKEESSETNIVDEEDSDDKSE